MRAIAKKIRWWQAAEIIGISDRHMRRWRERYEELGFRGLFDQCGKPAPKPGHLHLLRTGFAHPRPGEGRRYFVRNETSSTFQPKLGDHSTLDHPDTGMRARSREVSRCCNRVFQAADSGLLLCERDQQSVHANDLQIQ